jgi:hypothetical protein
VGLTSVVLFCLAGRVELDGVRSGSQSFYCLRVVVLSRVEIEDVRV